MEVRSQSALDQTPNTSHVPFLDLGELIRPIRSEIDSGMKNVIDGSKYIGGEELARFESNFSNWVGEGYHFVGCANGTDAITLAARALNLPAGATAIVPAMTYYATVSALMAAGLRIKLADITEDTWLLDPKKAEKQIDGNTKLLAPVHLYGQMAPMDEFREIANRHECKLLEDSAQSHGARWKGRPVGHWGDVATYSFFPGKNLGAFGDAGGVLSKDADLILTCRGLGNQGALIKYKHEWKGYNSRLDNLQAAVLNVKLKHLTSWNESRRKVADIYLSELSGISDLTLPTVKPEALAVFHIFAVMVPERERFQKHLSSKGIGNGIHYPHAIHQLKCFEAEAFAAERFPNAEKLAGHGLSLPMCPTLREHHVKRVVSVVRSYFGK